MEGGGGGGRVVVVEGAWVFLTGVLKLGLLAVLNLEPRLDFCLVVEGSSVVTGAGRRGKVVLIFGRSVRTWRRLGRVVLD